MIFSRRYMVDNGVQEELLRHLLKSQLVSQKELFAMIVQSLSGLVLFVVIR